MLFGRIWKVHVDKCKESPYLYKCFILKDVNRIWIIPWATHKIARLQENILQKWQEERKCVESESERKQDENEHRKINEKAERLTRKKEKKKNRKS